MSKSVFLSKETLLTQKDELVIERVELGKRGHVFIREMTGTEKSKWERACLKKLPKIGGARGEQVEYETNLEDYRAKLLICTMCDKDGGIMFDDIRDAKKLGSQLSAAHVEKLADVANRLNAITKEDQEQIVKNSEAGEKKGSDSASASN